MPLTMPVLGTARLFIRPFRLTDLDDAHQLMDHEAWQTGAAPDQRREWLEWTVRNYTALAQLDQPPYGDRAVVLRESGALVGAIGLVPALGPFGRLPAFGGDADARHFRPEFGLFWATRSAHRRQGYAAEAAQALIDFVFQTLRASHIVATTDDDNAGSQAVMRKLGMQIERNPQPEPEWFQVVGVLQNDA